MIIPHQLLPRLVILALGAVAAATIIVCVTTVASMVVGASGLLRGERDRK